MNGASSSRAVPAIPMLTNPFRTVAGRSPGGPVEPAASKGASRADAASGDGRSPEARPGAASGLPTPVAEKTPSSTGAPRTWPLRAMTGYEEEVIEIHRAHPNTAALCNDIVARCLVAPGADHAAALEQVRRLTVAERDAALVALRRLSLGDRVECEVDCPACEKKNHIDFLLSSLPVEGFAWVNDGAAGSLRGPLPESAGPDARVEVILADGAVAVMRLPNAGDQERLLADPPDTESERRTFLLASVLLRLGPDEGAFDPDRVRALPIADRRAMERAVEARTPDLDLSMAVTCSSCGAAFSAPFDVATFFLPR